MREKKGEQEKEEEKKEEKEDDEETGATYRNQQHRSHFGFRLELSQLSSEGANGSGETCNL